MARQVSSQVGIDRATADAALEIRSGELTRDEGVALVRRYDGEFPERFAEEVFAILALTLIVFCTVIQIGMPWAMHIFAPGFYGDPEKFDLAVELTRITFPYLLFISLVSQLSGILNSLGRFAAAAATPILFNVSLIAAIVALTPALETAGHALAWGVFVAGIVQFLWLIAACRRAGMTIRMPRPRLNAQVKRNLVLLLPGAIGAAHDPGGRHPPLQRQPVVGNEVGGLAMNRDEQFRIG